MDTTEIELPSGAILKVQLAPFADSRALYQAVLEELRGISVRDDEEIGVNLLKDVFCTGFSSKKIEAALLKCVKKALYNDLPISDETWEPGEARQDYMKAMIEVAKTNIAPFVKSLSAEFSLAKGLLQKDLTAKSETTPA